MFNNVTMPNIFWQGIVATILVTVPMGSAAAFSATAEEIIDSDRYVVGIVQYGDSRPAGQAIVELRDREGTLIDTGETTENGEFAFQLPSEGIVAIRATLGALRSQYLVIKADQSLPRRVVLTLSDSQEMALVVTAGSPPIHRKQTGEQYALDQHDIQRLPRGDNIELNDLLATIPSAVNGSLKQVHIRQDHANLQFRIDGVPIPDTVSSVFTDVISPRTWKRADIILGGPEAQYGNKTAAIIDITTKSGTKPGFGSVQLFGGSNETLTPSIEYGGTVGERFRFYALNSFTTTNRGIDPPTLGRTPFHDQSHRNQTFLRGDVQLDNRNSLTWLFLNSVAKFQIPTAPGRTPNQALVGLIQAANPGFTPVASEAIDENQKETNQYSHLVWRRDFDADRYLSVAGYFRHTRAMFTTDPFNVLAFTDDVDEPFSAGSQDRFAYSGGLRVDYTHRLTPQHLLKTGFQIDRTQAVNKTRLTAFARDAGGNPTGLPLPLEADNRTIGWREEFWIQDQWTPTERLTLNVGLRFDQIQAITHDGQLSPRIGVAYALTDHHVVHAFYGRLFTPPNLEAVRFAQLNTAGTTAEPENLTNNTVEPERAHYVEVGTHHALGKAAVVELTAFYKNSENLSDAGQFGTTPLLNFFAFERGIQYGVDATVKIDLSEDLTARGNVAWGRCKGKGLQSGHFLLEQAEIDDINTSEGVFCDHMQLVTSSAVVSYRFLPYTTLTGQMLFASGLRTAAPGAKTNSGHSPSYTIYNLTVNHEIPLWDAQKVVLGVDVINLLDQRYFINEGEGSIGLGVSHAGLPRSVFFRGTWLFDP